MRREKWGGRSRKEEVGKEKWKAGREISDKREYAKQECRARAGRAKVSRAMCGEEGREERKQKKLTKDVQARPI